MNVYVLTREFDIAGVGEFSLIVSIHATREAAQRALDAEPNQEPWYGKLAIGEWPVDA